MLLSLINGIMLKMTNMMIKTKIQQWRWRWWRWRRWWRCWRWSRWWRWWRWWQCLSYAHASDAGGEKSPVAASLSLSSCFKIIPVALRRSSRKDVELFWLVWKCFSVDWWNDFFLNIFFQGPRLDAPWINGEHVARLEKTQILQHAPAT